MIFLYGNCQIGCLFNILLLSEEFRNKYNLSYSLLNIKNITDHIKNDNYIRIVNYKSIKHNDDLSDILNLKYDLAILQYTASKHGKYSTEFIKNKLNCKNIFILPFVVNNGFLPITREGKLDSQMFKSNDKILELTNGNMGSQEIINLCYKHDLKTILHKLENFEIDFNLLERFNKSIEILQQKEVFCDITVSDIILKNKNIRLFHQNVHITGFLLQIITNIILNKIGLQSIRIYNTDYMKTLELDKKYNIQYTEPPPSSPYEIKMFNMSEKHNEKWLNYYTQKIIEIHNGFHKMTK